MAFKLATTKKVKWPVTVEVPQDGGKTQKAEFEVEFEVLAQDQLEALPREGKDMLAAVVIGWSGVQDEGGEPIEYSEEAKAQLLGVTYVRAALFGAYQEVQVGRAAARKNSR